ncbi:MAG: hypothetical protein JNJ45_11240 [Chthonomonas sp.]|nr:hypothetical protein [Chthonomonas sp.]
MNLVSALGLTTWIEPTRPNRRAFGVPDGGPLDAVSFRIATALAGSRSKVLEVVGAPVELAFDEPTWVAIAGAEGALTIDGLSRSHRNGRHRVQRSLVLAAPTHGWVTYVALASKLGALALGHPETLDHSTPLRMTPSPDDLDQSDVVGREWTVSITSDRRGWRLEGDAAQGGPQGESEMAIPGLVQLPPGGKPIVLGPDGPTVGGYAKLGVLLPSDRFALAQKRPGTPVQLASVTWEEARQAESTFEAALNETTARLAWL